MIVPMKKATLIVQRKDAESAVQRLGSLGVLHVEHVQQPKGSDAAALHDEISLVDQALGILMAASTASKPCPEDVKRRDDWKPVARHIIDSNARLRQLEEYHRNLANRIAAWEEWGDFDPDLVRRLAEKNIHVRLYSVPAGEMDRFPPQVIVKRLSSTRGMVNCAAISGERVEIPFKEAEPPKMGLSRMRARLADDGRVIRKLKTEVESHICYREFFERVKDGLKNKLEFREALNGMGRADRLAYLTGYVPGDAAASLLEAAKRERWAIVMADPSEDDNVPTLIRSPKWVSIIAPVFKLMEIIPGYREIDISPLFLLFLSLFFGMIIGDAGYGLLYIALTAFAQRRLGPKLKDARIFFLFYLFSSSAVLWGVLTGTVFGQEWLSGTLFRPLLPVLNDTKFLQAFCFGLGAFHLTLGQGWQAVRKLPSITALADVGWILVLWAAFFLARMLILDMTMPAFTNWLIIAGVSLVIIFTSPQRNILKMVGAGLGTVALSIMNSFTDVVSYVRLFAVGLAGVAISDTVNTLAATLGGDSVITRICILFLGHTINILLGPISVMVHGVRLNVLEFSGHAGLSWSGTSYKPLKS